MRRIHKLTSLSPAPPQALLQAAYQHSHPALEMIGASTSLLQATSCVAGLGEALRVVSNATGQDDHAALMLGAFPEVALTLCVTRTLTLTLTVTAVGGA